MLGKMQICAFLYIILICAYLFILSVVHVCICPCAYVCMYDIYTHDRMLGIKPRTSGLTGKYSPTELHPQFQIHFTFLVKNRDDFLWQTNRWVLMKHPKFQESSIKFHLQFRFSIFLRLVFPLREWGHMSEWHSYSTTKEFQLLECIWLKKL